MYSRHLSGTFIQANLHVPLLGQQRSPSKGIWLALVSMVLSACGGAELDASDIDELSQGAVSPPVLKTATFTVGTGFGPALIKSEFDNLKATRIELVSAPSPSGSAPSAALMSSTLTMALNNGVKAVVNDSILWDNIKNCKSTNGCVIADKANEFYNRYSSNITAGKYFWVFDEPSTQSFSNIEAVAAKLKTRSARTRWVNIYPSGLASFCFYDMASPCTGAYTYSQYVKNFISKTPSVDLVSFDHYPFLADGTTQVNDWFASLETIRTEAKAAGRKYGAVIQASAFTGHRNPNRPEMSWQAMSALAYGAKMIGWFSWSSMSNLQESIVGFGGSSTDRSEALYVNDRIRGYGDFLTDAISEAVWHADTAIPGTSVRPVADPVTLPKGPFYVGRLSVPGQSGKFILIGNRDSRSLKDLFSVKICPLSTTGRVWTRKLSPASWALVDSLAPQGACVTFDTSLDAGDARMYYIN